MHKKLFLVCFCSLLVLGCQNQKKQNNTAITSYPTSISSKVNVLPVIPNAIAKYQQAIESEQDLNVLNQKGNTFLVQAIEENLIPAVKLLIQAGVDLNMPSKNGITPLMAVINNGNKSIPKTLNNGSVVHIDVKGSVNKSLMSQLIQAGADVNHANHLLQTPLMIAASLNNLDAVQLLIEQKADLNARDFNGMSAISFAVSNNYPEIVKALLKAGADANSVDSQGQTPLIYAAESGNLEITKLLVSSDADVNLKDAYDVSPLHTAKLNDNKDVEKFLNKHGAKE